MRLGDIVPAIEQIYPNAVVTPDMAAAMYAATQKGGGMGATNGIGLGCTNPMTCWGSAWAGNPTRGADVDYGIVGLNGVGDWVPAGAVGLFPVDNPIHAYASRGQSNGILNGLAGLRGLGAFDTSSAANFLTSVESGSSTDPIFGITLPNWAWLLGGVGLVVALTSKSSGGFGGRKRNPRRRPAKLPGWAATTRRRNVEAGYYNQTGFHPIRSSRDYDPDRAGDEY